MVKSLCYGVAGRSREWWTQNAEARQVGRQQVSGRGFIQTRSLNNKRNPKIQQAKTKVRSEQQKNRITKTKEILKQLTKLTDEKTGLNTVGKHTK